MSTKNINVTNILISVLMFILGLIAGYSLSPRDIKLKCFMALSPLTNRDKSVILSDVVLSCTPFYELNPENSLERNYTMFKPGDTVVVENTDSKYYGQTGTVSWVNGSQLRVTFGGRGRPPVFNTQEVNFVQLEALKN